MFKIVFGLVRVVIMILIVSVFFGGGEFYFVFGLI